MKKNANWWFVMRKSKPQKLLRIMKLIFLMCVWHRDLCFGQIFGSTADYDAIGRDRIKGGV